MPHHSLNSQQQRVHKLVLTGGPCGGKTTAMTRLTSFFSNLGWKVLCVPETATVILSGGVKFAELTSESLLIFETNLQKTLLQLEETFHGVADASVTPALVIHDRGFMDARAYMSEAEWQKLAEPQGWCDTELRDRRYDSVVHLVTAADGAAEFYSLDTNKGARTETIDAALTADKLIQKAWLGHPDFHVIDNSTGFDEKINRLLSAVCSSLEIDPQDRLSPGATKRKWIVEETPKESDYPDNQMFDVEQIQLISRLNQEMRLRKRTQNGNSTYQLTTRDMRGSQLVERRAKISEREFLTYKERKSEDHLVAVMRRRCFVFHHQYFQLDTYLEPCQGLITLYTYADKHRTDLSLPSWIKISKEVTGLPEFSTYQLTMKQKS